MREKLSLNGRWSFQIDRKDEGERLGWHNGNALPAGSEVEVPHIWQTEAEHVHYCGTAWYEKSFAIDVLPEGKRSYLHFGAVDFQARVWLNGTFIGEHEGGFTPFEFDVTDYLKEGLNSLCVRVFDPQDNAEIPIGKQGSWYTRISGIWQEVYLETRSASFIKHVHVQPNIDDSSIQAAVTVIGEQAAELQIEYTITEHLNPEQVVGSFTSELPAGKAVHTISLPNAKLWSPEQPQLYDITATIKDGEGAIVDQYGTYFGMREIRFAEGQLLLNHKPIFVRGALDQAFYPDTIYIAPSDEWIKNEIELAKGMGFNLLRKHIKVEIPRYLYWADRMGMLIWAEPPNFVKWTAQSRARFVSELRGMIERDYNRPSILIWSLYNEEWGLEWDLANDVEKQEHVKALYAEVKELDPTRLICDNSGWIHVQTDINDYHRYFSVPEQIDEWRDDIDRYMAGTPEQNFVKGYAPQGQPIIISEFGVWGLPSVKKLLEYYGSEPSWFANLGDDTHREDFKMPLNAFAKIEKYQLDRIFGDMENLSAHSQKRMFRAVKSLIEEMRKREAINGYVVTEFTDIEWETNGWLDYTRSLKAGFEHASDFNGELIVMVDKENRNLWSGEEQCWDIVISNHGLHEMKGTVEWEIAGTGLKGSVPVNAGNDAFVKLSGAIRFSAPQSAKSDFYTLNLSLIIDGKAAAKNEYELTVSPKQEAAAIRVCAYGMDNAFRSTLMSNGLVLTDNLLDAEAVITSTLDTAVLDYYRNGGHVVFLAEEGDRLSAKGQFTFRQLIQGESWDRTSSFNYADPSFFEGVPLNAMMGWEMEGLYPEFIIPFSNYNKLGGTIGRVVYMFGNEGITESSEIIAGYFQGWIGQAGGSLIVQKSAEGSLILTTWKLKGQYGTHPIATGIVNALIEKCRQGK